MKTYNFPGRVRIRREQALARMIANGPCKNVGSTADEYERYLKRRAVEMETLRARTK